MTKRNRSLNIHFFTTYVHKQGTYFRYHNLAVGLVRLGHRVTVYGGDFNTASRSRIESREGVRYDIVPESCKTSVFSQGCHPLTTLRRAWRQYPKCDVGHLFQPFVGAEAAWRSCQAQARFYDWDDLWTDGLWVGPCKSWRDWWPRFIVARLEATLPRRAGHVTVVSRFLADLARARGASGVSVLHNGCWPTSPLCRVAARSRLGLRPDALYAGFMGRTTNELGWCIEAVAANIIRHPALRLALCGPPESIVYDLPDTIRGRIDYLGQLTPEDTRAFASAIDLGLLPLADDDFNRSRFPIKFSEHLATGVPLLCSDVGECGQLAKLFPWALVAGTTRDEWIRAFTTAIDQLDKGDRPRVDLKVFAEHLSWERLSRQLESLYHQALTSQRGISCI